MIMETVVIFVSKGHPTREISEISPREDNPSACVNFCRRDKRGSIVESRANCNRFGALKDLSRSLDLIPHLKFRLLVLVGLGK